MKKLICLLLCLLLPAAALAAPTREARANALQEGEMEAMRAWLDSTVRAVLPTEYDENTYVGARIYSCVEDAGCYVLECDVYLENGADSLPEYAPDDSVTWLCGATVCVQRQEEGWQCLSCEVGEYYQFTEMVPADGEGYTVTLPDIYTEDQRDVYDYSCYDDQGSFVSGIRYRAEETAGRSAADYARSIAGDSEDLILDEQADLNTVTAQATGMYVIVYEGGGVFHSLTLTFPEEREAEFTLYGEFMRNSFVVEGEVNG